MVGPILGAIPAVLAALDRVARAVRLRSSIVVVVIQLIENHVLVPGRDAQHDRAVAADRDGEPAGRRRRRAAAGRDRRGARWPPRSRWSWAGSRTARCRSRRTRGRSRRRSPRTTPTALQRTLPDATPGARPPSPGGNAGRGRRAAALRQAVRLADDGQEHDDADRGEGERELQRSASTGPPAPEASVASDTRMRWRRSVRRSVMAVGTPVDGAGPARPAGRRATLRARCGRPVRATPRPRGRPYQPACDRARGDCEPAARHRRVPGPSPRPGIEPRRGRRHPPSSPRTAHRAPGPRPVPTPRNP